jgi:cytochrome d ubiquinol oxidase subunit II
MSGVPAALDFVPIWTAIIAFGVFMYVLMDGFDLGVGILFRAAPDETARDLMMNSVAPVWDFNETWLVLGGVALLAAFPLAFAIVVPALYFPILAMLLALIFRGVAFEFRAKADTSRQLWNNAFHYGSVVATFAQGVVLGTFVRGFPVEGRQFAGGIFDWLTPFSLLTGIGLLLGYGLLGATWLVLKTEGALQDWARLQSRWLTIAVLAVMGIVSLWTPFLNERIAERWFSWPNLALLSPVPIVTLGLALWLWHALSRRRDFAPFVAAIGLFTMGYLGLAISLWPNIVPHTISLWDAAAAPRAQAFLLVGTLFLLPVILGYTAWSYWVFRGKVRADIGYH